MGSAKETERKIPVVEVDKTIDVSDSDDGEDESDVSDSNVSESDGRVDLETWMAKSDAWREKTDDKLKALTDVLLETRELVRSLSRVATTRHPDTYQAPPAELDGRAAREEATASNSLDTGNPEEREDLLAPQVPAPLEIKEDVKPTIKDRFSKTGGGSRTTPSSAQRPVKEDEIRAVLLQRSPLTISELVATFKARLKSPENKKVFAETLKRISKIQKMNNNHKYVVLRKYVKEDEIRAVLLQKSPLTTSELVARFKARLKSPEDKKAFAETLRRISKIQKTNNNQNYIVLRK